MSQKLPCLFFGIVLLTFSVSSFSQNMAEDVRVKLSLTDGKTVYRIGEPIRLILSLTASVEGYQVDVTTTQPASPTDEIFLSPDSGVYHWLDTYSGNNRYRPDYFSIVQISTTPTEVMLPLNQWFRFDTPGHYSVRVKTNRVFRRISQNKWAPKVSLTTNEVSFEVKAMSEAEEEKEVQRLSSLIDGTIDLERKSKYAGELSFLTGDVSTREKVKRFLNIQNIGADYYQEIYFGLFMARNQSLVLKLMEEALRNTNLETSGGLLHTVSKLRLIQERIHSPTTNTSDESQAAVQEYQRLSDIRRSYIKELAAGLSKREGKNLTGTAITILTGLPRNEPQDSEVIAKVREILLREFDNLHPYDQSHLLTNYWEKLKDPVLLPSIERMLTKNRDPRHYQLRAAAIQRILDIAPERARPFVIYEILEPRSFADFEVLKMLKDPVLPETDVALLERIRIRGENNDTSYLRHSAILAARFATAAIYDELMKIYKTHGAKWELGARGSLLAYFVRHNEKEAIPLIEQELAGLLEQQNSSFFAALTKAYYSEAINELLKKRLNSDIPDIATSVPWLMSKYGPASNEQVFRDRLARWRREWGGRVAEIDAAGSDQKIKLQARIETELVLALMRAKAWKLSETEINQLKQSCVSQSCRRLFPNQ